MKNLRFYFILAVLIFIGCEKKINSPSVVLTTSFFSNPEQPRFGIEIKDDTLFYCKEITKYPGRYDTYYCIYNYEELKEIQDEIRNAFKRQLKLNEESDATLCQLNIKTEVDNIKILFNMESLSAERSEIIQRLIELKKCNLRPIKFHKFPMELLNAKMPVPPKVIISDNVD